MKLQHIFKVFIAGIRVNTKRNEDSSSKVKTRILQCKAIRLDIDRHMTFLHNKHIDLLATEFAILRHFLSNPDIVFTRRQIINAIHGTDYPATDRSVDVQILGLRKKLQEAGVMIETVRRVGYRFRATELIA